MEKQLLWLKVRLTINFIKKILNLKLIERLCRAFECEPNHLFVYEGEAEAGQPVTGLRAVTGIDFRDVSKGVPLGRLEEFRKKVEEVKRGM